MHAHWRPLAIAYALVFWVVTVVVIYVVFSLPWKRRRK
jgi:hypothetical protein